MGRHSQTKEKKKKSILINLVFLQANLFQPQNTVLLDKHFYILHFSLIMLFIPCHEIQLLDPNLWISFNFQIIVIRCHNYAHIIIRKIMFYHFAGFILKLIYISVQAFWSANPTIVFPYDFKYRKHYKSLFPIPHISWIFANYLISTL